LVIALETVCGFKPARWAICLGLDIPILTEPSMVYENSAHPFGVLALFLQLVETHPKLLPADAGETANRKEDVADTPTISKLFLFIHVAF